MRSIEIPLPQTNGGAFRIGAVLSGVTYYLKFRWNERGQYWVMDFLDPASRVIEAGIRLVLDYPLISRSSDPRMPPGWLILEDATRSGKDPGSNELGGRVRLFYVPK